MTVEKLRWNPTVHAVRRIKERCGIEETQAKAFINQLMTTAKYVTTQGNRLIYLHEKRELMIVVNAEEGAVITVHPAESAEQQAPVAEVIAEQPKGTLTVARIAQAVKREFERMSKQINREVRKLSEQHAQLNVQIAELTLNQIRCDAPHTKALIQSRIEAAKAQVTELATEIDVKLTQIKQAEREVKAVISE